MTYAQLAVAEEYHLIFGVAPRPVACGLEAAWLDRIDRELQSMPDDEKELQAEMKAAHNGLFSPSSHYLA